MVGRNNHEWNVASLKVLVVDDDPLACKIMETSLQAIGVQDVEVANNGADALKAMLMEHDPFDLVVSDLNMGPINGLELLKVIRIGYKNIKRGTRFIVFTGLVDMALVPPALALDVNGFLPKPVSIDHLKDAIKHAFDLEVAGQDPNVYRRVHVPTTSDLKGIADKAGLSSLPSLDASTEDVAHVDAFIDFEGREILEVIPLPEMAGYILAEDIVSHNGKLLLAAGMELTAGLLNNIISLQKIDKTLGRTIFVMKIDRE